jgi:hypothetical protein
MKVMWDPREEKYKALLRVHEPGSTGTSAVLQSGRRAGGRYCAV